MPLYFRDRRHRPLGRGAQFAFAFMALALVLALVIVWMVVSYYADRSRNPENTDSSSAPPAVSYTGEDTGHLLVVLRQEDSCHAVLLQTSPADRQIYAVPLPGGLTVDGQTGLATVLIKDGAAAGVQLVANATQLPVQHYIQMTTTQVESYLTTFEGTIALSLPQTVAFADENGAKHKFKAGEHTLNAAQVAGLLRYTGWKKATDSDRIAAQIITSLLNQHLTPQRYIAGDFAALSNLSTTDLRISHFSEWQERLNYLATSNSGTLCQIIELTGDTDQKGLFTLNPRYHKDTPLYIR